MLLLILIKNTGFPLPPTSGMHWKCLFVFKNTCNFRPATLWFFAVILASIVFLSTLFTSLFLPACVYETGIEKQHFNIDMLEESLITKSSRSCESTLVERLRNNISELSRELRQLQATVSIYEKLGKVMETDSSLATFGSKRHQNIMITSVPNSGEVFLGELFNQHRDVFYLFEPFHSLKYYRENRPPEVYTSMLQNFLKQICSCDFSHSNFYTEFLSRHYRALVHRLASRTLSSPPLCPEFIYGRSYNIRHCSYLRPPTLTAICKLHDYTVVKTTQLVDLERLTEHDGDARNPFRVVEVVRDPRAVLHTQLRESGNVSESLLINEARKVCRQQLRNRRYLGNPENKQMQRHIMVKYEDLVSSTSQVFEDLCTWLGIPHSTHLSSWLNGVLKNGFTWPISMKRITLNLTRSISEWQRGLEAWQIRLIEQECYTAMKILGYKLYN